MAMKHLCHTCGYYRASVVDNLPEHICATCKKQREQEAKEREAFKEHRLEFVRDGNLLVHIWIHIDQDWDIAQCGERLEQPVMVTEKVEFGDLCRECFRETARILNDVWGKRS